MSKLSNIKGALAGIMATAMTAVTPLQAEETNKSHNASNSYSASYNNAASQQKLSQQEMCDEMGLRQEACDGLGYEGTVVQYDIYQMGQVAENNGVGIFINLAKHDPVGGKAWGDKLKNGFIARGIDADYRFAESNGTATQFTFYVREAGEITVTSDELRAALARVFRLQHGGITDKEQSNDEIAMNRTIDR